MRIELTTSSLPRKCSTPELQQLERGQTKPFQKTLFQLINFKKPITILKWAVVDSNHRSRRQRIYSPLHLATLVTAHLDFSIEDQ